MLTSVTPRLVMAYTDLGIIDDLAQLVRGANERPRIPRNLVTSVTLAPLKRWDDVTQLAKLEILHVSGYALMHFLLHRDLAYHP